jgi:hypothetical protein
MLKKITIDRVGVVLLIELKRFINSVFDLILIYVNFEYGCPEIAKAVIYQRLS